MKDNKAIKGFSKLNKKEKVEWLKEQLNLDDQSINFIADFESKDKEAQHIISDLSENHLSNFHFPFSVAPNFMINGNYKVFPLVTEESSVVAALAKAAGFWAQRGGFHAKILGTTKKGQLHFKWNGNPELLSSRLMKLKFFYDERQSQLVRKWRSGVGEFSQLN